jgi:hypothetical protein
VFVPTLNPIFSRSFFDFRMNTIKSYFSLLLLSFTILGLSSSCSDQGEKANKLGEAPLGRHMDKVAKEKIKLNFYEKLKETTSFYDKESHEGPEIIMHTRKPEEGQVGSFYSIDSFTAFNADLDGDNVSEKVNLMYLNYKEYDDLFAYTSLVVDVFKYDKLILRQELERGFFFAEQFFAFKDLDKDRRNELITQVRFSPDCSGYDTYRIYNFIENSFDLKLNLFNVDMDLPSLGTLMKKLSDFQEKILAYYNKLSNSEYPCGYWNDCSTSDPWLVDTENDGQPEIILLVEPPYNAISKKDNCYHLLIVMLSADGQIFNYSIQRLEIDYWRDFVSVLGFLKTHDNHIHLLINFAYEGNSAGDPVLHIFDVRESQAKEVGKFGGFYEPDISERLRDLDNDGNTEIIYVENSYWPPGKSHSEIILWYGIAEYQNGHYKNANDKFKKSLEQLNVLERVLR